MVESKAVVDDVEDVKEGEKNQNPEIDTKEGKEADYLSVEQEGEGEELKE